MNINININIDANMDNKELKKRLKTLEKFLLINNSHKDLPEKTLHLDNTSSQNLNNFYDELEKETAELTEYYLGKIK